MKIKGNTILQRVEAYYRLFDSDGETLVIIEPGYIVNKYAYMIWRLLDKEKTLDELLRKLCIYIEGASEKDLMKMVTDIIEMFYIRSLVRVDGDVIDQKQYTYQKTQSEIDMYNTYRMTPVTQVDLVVSAGCNFSCRHCFLRHKDNKEISSMKLDDWKMIIDKLSKNGLISVIITGGEPFIYEDLFELIDYIDALGIKIQLLTNGYLLTEEKAQKLSTYKNIIVQVSLDGSSALSNDFQRGEGTYEKVVENLSLLVKYQIETIVAMVLNKSNIRDIYDDSMFRKMEKLGVGILAITPTVIKVSNALENKDDFLSANEALEVIQYIKRYVCNYNGKMIINISAPPALVKDLSVTMVRKERSRCRRGTNSFSIRSNGEVCVCSDFMEIGYSDYELGNILNDNFEDILDNLNNIRIKKHQLQMKIKGVCSICKELPYCGGACRAAAFAEYGDILSPYPLCQELYDKGIFPKEFILSDGLYIEYK